jgi:hypothetical protein
MNFNRQRTPSLKNICREEMEFENFLSGLHEGEFEDFPKAIRSEFDKETGTTLFFEIDLKFKKADTSYCVEYKKVKPAGKKEKKVCINTKYVSCISPETAVFYPKNFDANKDCVLLFYFHGFLIAAPGIPSTIREYLNYNGKRGSLQLREEIARSGKNVILIAPALGPSAQAGSLMKKDGWDSYLKKIKLYISKCILKKELRNEKIILAGHSGAGKILLQIAGFSPVHEVWGFDSLYQGGDPWIKLAKEKRELKLFFYDHGNDKQSAVDAIEKAKVNNLRVIKVFTPSKASAAIKVQPSLQLIAEDDPHFRLVRPALGERLASLNHTGVDTDREAENSYDGCSQMRADKCQTIRDDAPLSKFNCAYKPKTMKREFEYETVLDELMSELLYDIPQPDLNLALRKKAAEIALTEYQLLWDSGKRRETECLVTDVLIGYYVEGLKFKPEYAKQYVRDIQCARKVKKIDPKTKKKYYVDVPCYTRKNADDLPKKCHSHAWSAAFISWVMRKAIDSSGRNIDFLYSKAHIWYMSKGKAAKKAKDTSYPFWTYTVDEVKPEIGDLVCFSRPQTKGCVGGLTEKNMTSGKGYCSHCDIVVNVTDTEVHTIGGNTEDFAGASDTVGMKKLAIGTDGKLITKGKRYVGIIKYIGDK